MKKKLVLMFLPFFILPLVVGGGFAFFYFGDDKTSSSQDVNISITDKPELGSIKLVYESIDSEGNKVHLDEETSSLTTQLFMDIDSIYFIRSDNLSAKRNFMLDYKSPSDNFATIPDGYSIGLISSFIIEDTDARGYKSETFNQDNEIIHYPTSNSIIDFFEPTYVTYKEDNRNIKYDLVSGDDSSTRVVYSCLIQSNVAYSSSQNLHFTMEMAYKNYIFNQNGEIFEGSMSPDASTSKEEFKHRIESNNIARKNSKITVEFSLTLVETGN